MALQEKVNFSYWGPICFSPYSKDFSFTQLIKCDEECIWQWFFFEFLVTSVEPPIYDLDFNLKKAIY